MIKLPRRSPIDIILILSAFPTVSRFEHANGFRFLHRQTCNATSTFPIDESQKTRLSGSARRKLINYYANNGREDWNETSGT